MRALRPTIAIPGLVGGALLVGGRAIAGCVAIGVTIVQLQAPLVAPAATERAERALSRVGHAATHVLTLLVWYPVGAVFVVTGGLARAVRIRPLDHRSGWAEPSPRSTNLRSARASWAVHGPAPMTGRERAARYARRAVAAAVALVVLLAVFEAGPWAADPSSSPSTDARGGAITPIEPPYAVRGQADIDQVGSEEGEVFSQMEADPVVGWRLPASFTGEVLSVEDHHRASVQASDEGPVVWFFGGSTMFGSNQSDARTIPSVFARLAAADGRPVQVVNFGVHAYTAYQEAQLLQQAVEEHGRPDLVVFYDGYNDTTVGMGTSFLGAAPGVPQRAPSPVAGAATSAGATERPTPRWLSPAQRYASVAAIQAKAQALARRAVGPEVPVLHFWQPNAFTRPLTREERTQLHSLGLDDHAIETFEAIHAGVRKRLPEGTIDLGDALDDAPTVFVDPVHTNERGAELVAQAMYDAALPTLRRL
ncbi:MAG: SGNH/GDSL hydrolase family protein [Aquihabitans sp.]